MNNRTNNPFNIFSASVERLNDDAFSQIIKKLISDKTPIIYMSTSNPASRDVYNYIREQGNENPSIADLREMFHIEDLVEPTANDGAATQVQFNNSTAPYSHTKPSDINFPSTLPQVTNEVIFNNSNQKPLDEYSSQVLYIEDLAKHTNIGNATEVQVNNTAETYYHAQPSDINLPSGNNLIIFNDRTKNPLDNYSQQVESINDYTFSMIIMDFISAKTSTLFMNRSNDAKKIIYNYIESKGSCHPTIMQLREMFNIEDLIEYMLDDGEITQEDLDYNPADAEIEEHPYVYIDFTKTSSLADQTFNTQELKTSQIDTDDEFTNQFVLTIEDDASSASYNEDTIATQEFYKTPEGVLYLSLYD